VNNPRALYKGVQIQVQPRDLGNGEWRADFTLFDEQGSFVDTPHYELPGKYSNREEAVQAALEAAWQMIDSR